MKTWMRPACFFLGAVLLSACFFGRSVQSQYYVLDYTPAPSAERLQHGPYPFVLRLRNPVISEAYARDEIIYRESPYQVSFYAYHLWAVDPDRMIGDLLLKHLQAAQLFKNVIRTVEPYAPDFTLTADIQAIEEYDEADNWYAHLAIEYQLLQSRSGQVVWKKLYDLRRVVPQKEPVYVVRELSGLLETIQDSLVGDLEVPLGQAESRLSADSGAATR
jgi:ABC-type uncharacterized transport system auxiliary subunit